MWDEETGLYYLRSRYYDPETCRVMTPDALDTLTASTDNLTDKNVYTYCDNNPVARNDVDGAFWNIIVGAVLGAVISAGVQIISNAIEDKPVMDGVVSAVASGAITGAVAATGIGVAGQMAVGFATGSAADLGQQLYDNEGDFGKVDYLSVAVSGGTGLISGWIGGNGLLHYKSGIMRDGARIIKVIGNVDKGMYKTAAKGFSRLTSVGTQVINTYTREGRIAAARYVTGAVASKATYNKFA